MKVDFGPLVALAGLAAVPMAAAQPLADRPAVRQALAALERENQWTLEQQISLCEIPAPPFDERARGAELADRLRALGYARVRVDSVGNVIAEKPGSGRGRRLLLSAHLDTVFPKGTDVRVTRRGSRLEGPGIGDDCRGLAVLLAVARAVVPLELDGDLLIVGTVGEEGAGNLRGVRHLIDGKSAGRVDAFLSIDGVGLGLTTNAVGSHRYEIHFEGSGGHSYGDFGMPNPIHALGRAVAAIADLEVPSEPKTTFNVGVVAGGTSVNSIAGSASIQVDLRSESQAALDQADAGLRAAVDQAITTERSRWPNSSKRLAARWREIGKRPAGVQPDTLWLVQMALEAGGSLGIDRPKLDAASTDANLPIARGVPSLTIEGGGSGDGAHSLGEWYDDGDRGYLGAQRVVLLTLMVVGLR